MQSHQECTATSTREGYRGQQLSPAEAPTRQRNGVKYSRAILVCIILAHAQGCPGVADCSRWWRTVFKAAKGLEANLLLL
jgi:hypothetical protein